MQRVKGKKQPKIEVMDRSLFAPEPATATPEWAISQDYQPLDPELLPTCTTLQITVQLPMLVSGLGIQLEGSCEHLTIVAGKLYALQLWMPRKVDVEGISAVFSCAKRELRLNLPVYTGERVESDTAVTETVLRPVALPAHELLYDIV
jgi:hypothetical protein